MCSGWVWGTSPSLRRNRSERWRRTRPPRHVRRADSRSIFLRSVRPSRPFPGPRVRRSRSPLSILLLATVAAAVTLGVGTGVASAQLPAAEFAARRAALLEAAEDGVILVPGSGEPMPDFLPFAQARHFLYLTGFLEPDAALVMVKRGGERTALLFVREKDPAQEVWTGARVGVAAARERYGVEGRDVETLDAVLDSLLRLAPVLQVAGRTGTSLPDLSRDDQLVAAIIGRHPSLMVKDVGPVVGRLRGRKSPAELERLRIAAEISAQGHLAVMRAVQPGMAEFELQALAEYTWRREGGDGPAYASIVGSGPNATTLHYNRNDRVAQDGEVIVMDMASFFDGYAADVTRTVPVSGRFSAPQRAIYEIVLAAQKAAERQVKVDAPWRALTDAASTVLADGLADLGLTEGAGATYDCGGAERARQCSQLSLYYMHGLGHGIGLDVHDPDQYATTGRIGVGSAFTLEPGLYVRANLLEIIPDTPRNRRLKARIAAAVAMYANIGVRIEDDFLVTDAGVLRASAGVPRELDEVERELARPRPARDASVVERYLRYKTGR